MKKCLTLLLLILLLVNRVHNIDPKPVILAVEETVPPRYANVDWYNPVETISYIRDVYGKFSDLLIWVVNRESSFNPEAENPKPPLQYGFGQITRVCAEGLSMSYDSVLIHPWYNLEVTSRYWTQCLKKANWNRDQAYKYYTHGLYYDDPRYLLKKQKKKNIYESEK